MDIEKVIDRLSEESDKWNEEGKVPLSKKTATIVDISACGLAAVCGAGASRIISSAVEAALPPGAKFGAKVLVRLGGFALEGCADYAIFMGAKGLASTVKGGIVFTKTVRSIIKDIKECNDGAESEVAVELEESDE